MADTAAVVEHVGTDSCLVAGWSGGGPHALACAARLGAARGVLVIAGVAPFVAEHLDWVAGMGRDNVEEVEAALGGEDSLRSFLDDSRQRHLNGASVEGIISSLESLLPDVDKALITGEFGEDLVAEYNEALRNGVDGWLDDDLAFMSNWGFELGEISRPTMIWQGSEDLMVPFAHGRWLASHVPRAHVHLEEGEGHLSIALGAIDRMLDELIEASA